MFRWISAYLLIACTPASAQPQANGEPIKHIIESKAFGTEREVDVFLPAAYFGDDSTRSFVTAYVFDAQFEPYFTMVSSIMSYYATAGEGIPMIVPEDTVNFLLERGWLTRVDEHRVRAEALFLLTAEGRRTGR